MHTSQKRIAALIAGAATLTMLLSTPVFAQDNVAGDKASVPMVSGGVGEQELDQLKALEHEYNLKFLFAETNGVYLSEVSLHIADGQGNAVVDTVSKGPILLATLPPGSYKATATSGDETKEQTISVTPKGLREYVFRFRARDETSGDSSKK